MLLAGVDEVGRGPLAGPVVAAAVILDPAQPIEGLADSKKLSAKKRESLSLEIQAKAIAWSIAQVEPTEIDELNIHFASLLAMKRAIEALSIRPEYVQVDGKFCPDISQLVEAIIGGDALIPSISAASILAKVNRDAQMCVWDQEYPQYGFAAHKGYGTKQHLAALKSYGITVLHRRSYAPVREVLLIND